MTLASKSRLPTGAAITWLLLAMTAAAADGYEVVINTANPVTSLERKKVSALFLKRASQWDNGTLVLPVDGPGSPARESFSKEVHGKKATAVKSYWLQIIFSGRGIPPPEKPSDKDVIAYVKAHPGAIGYVSASTATDEVKVLEVRP